MGSESMRKPALLAFAAMLGWASAAASQSLIGNPNAPKPTPEGAEAAIRKHFEVKLFDGESARIQMNPRIIWGDIELAGDRYYGWWACGRVNAKNRYGAYVGYQPFLIGFDPYDPGKVKLSGVGGADMPTESIDLLCRRMGL